MAAKPGGRRRALDWRAADQGYVEALTTLGTVHIQGLLGEPDMVQAYKWFRLAAHLGEEQAAMITAQLEKDMSPADLAVARKLVKEWTPK